MRIGLSPELEAGIAECVASGRYNSGAEVVREALRVFLRVEAIREAAIARFARPERPPLLGRATVVEAESPPEAVDPEASEVFDAPPLAVRSG
jgi:putative addiction module CopG family antidote